MRSLLRKLRAARKLHRVRRALGSALALQRRGEIRSDGLSPFSFSIRLSVSWRARDIHPWDRDLPEERIAPRFVEQTLHDTEDAVERIFSAFPEANTLEVNVFAKDSTSDRVIISGVVLRSDLGRCSSSSISMRLRMLGINYRLVNEHFDPIAIGTSELQPADLIARDFRFGWPRADVERPPTELITKSRPRWPDKERRPN
jgi:hypothetical protein